MTMQRILAVVLFCVGLLCLAQAQVPMTGAGKGAPGGGGGGNVVLVNGVGTFLNFAASPSSYPNAPTIAGGLTDPALIFVVVNAGANSMTSPAAICDPVGVNVSMSLLLNQDAGGGRQVLIFGKRNPPTQCNSGGMRFQYTGTNTDGFMNAILFTNVNPASDAAAFPNFTGSNTPGTPNSITITSGTNNYVIAGWSSLSNTSVSDTQLFLANTGSVWDTASNYKASTGATDTLTASPGGMGTSAGGTIAHD